MKQPRFANGRSVRNALERARLRQASRIVNLDRRKLTKQDLICIEADDILKSRVFGDDEVSDGQAGEDIDIYGEDEEKSEEGKAEDKSDEGKAEDKSDEGKAEDSDDKAEGDGQGEASDEEPSSDEAEPEEAEAKS